MAADANNLRGNGESAMQMHPRPVARDTPNQASDLRTSKSLLEAGRGHIKQVLPEVYEASEPPRGGLHNPRWGGGRGNWCAGGTHKYANASVLGRVM